jgi:DNA-binding NarL/FixJ family response regulator
MPVKKPLPDRRRTLSSRQKRVAELVSHGLRNREIALEMEIAVHVVRNYLTSIYDKVGASNRVELARVSTRSCTVPSTCHPTM